MREGTRINKYSTLSVGKDGMKECSSYTSRSARWTAFRQLGIVTFDQFPQVLYMTLIFLIPTGKQVNHKPWP